MEAALLDREKGIFQSKGYIPSMRRRVNFPNNETISVTKDTFDVTIWLSVSQSTLSFHGPLVFYTDQIRTLNTGVEGIATLAFFKSLMVTLISALYQKQHCF